VNTGTQLLSPFTDSSVDNVLLQSLVEFIDVPSQRLIDSLLHDTANIVSSDRQLASKLDYDKNYDKNAPV